MQFYTGLPSYEILRVVLEHVSPFVAHKTLSLDRFQEFVMVLMKLRLNVPLQDLAYRFKVSQPTVSRIFSSWLVVMDNRLPLWFLGPKGSTNGGLCHSVLCILLEERLQW